MRISLPHGAKRLLEIAVTLAIVSKLLRLDEPLAGLAEADRVVVADLIRKLARSHAVLLIDHDRDRVPAISDRLSVLHQGRIVADGKPADVAANPEVIAAYIGATKSVARTAPLSTERQQHGAARALPEVNDLASGYGGSTVLSGLSMTVHEGEAVALLGCNGVGKTTTLRARTGSLPLARGTMTFDGHTLRGLKP